MKKVIFCNSLSKLKKYLNGQTKAGYLFIDWNSRTFSIKQYLDKQRGYKQINVDDFSLWK